MNDRQREKLAGYVKDADNITEAWQISRWSNRVTAFLTEAMGADAADHFNSLASIYGSDELALKSGHLEGLMAKGEDEPPTTAPNSSNRQKVEPEPSASNTRDVFVVHGHDGEAKESVARFLEKLELTAIVLHEQPNEGRTLIEKFETSSKNVAFAVVLLTPDDLGRERDKPEKLEPRARQNVILELGYFMGRLGRTRVCALYKGGVELPSDFQGVVYIEIDSAGAWRTKLAQELLGAKITIKLEGLLNK
jgi:predicted nucleotide-binding protein